MVKNHLFHFIIYNQQITFITPAFPYSYPQDLRITICKSHHLATSNGTVALRKIVVAILPKKN